jgi:hypothetical protein
VTAAELRALRAHRQRLHRPAGDGPAAIVRALLAVQAQDLRAARLALRARGCGFRAADVDVGLGDERTLVVAWLARRTLHLVAREDYGWLHGLTAPAGFAGSARRLAQEGVTPADADRAVAIIERALADDGPLTRPQLAERIAAAGIRTHGQATPHLLALSALRGVAVLGPVRAGGQAFALTRDWLGSEPVPLTGDGRTTALAELARRWLAAHGPATAADLAAWAGLPLRDARAGLEAIAGELNEPGGELVDLAVASRRPSRAPLVPRLLGAFDPYLLGWRDRSFALAPEHARRVHPGGGMLRPVGTANGEVVGTWTRGRRAVELHLFDRDDDLAAALRADAEDVARFEAVSA